MTYPVTAAIPVYNGDKFLEDALNSIIGQTLNVSEILIVENNSSDSSLKIAQKLKEANPSLNMHIYTSEHTMPYADNWNRCFEFAGEQYVLILHADDKLIPHAIEKLYNFLIKNNECALVGGREIFIDAKEKPFKKELIREELYFKKKEITEFIIQTGSYIPCSTVLFDLNKIKKVGYFPSGKVAADELYWPQILYHYPIAIIPENISFRRIHESNFEYIDQLHNKKKILNSLNDFIELVNLEERLDKRRKIKKYIIHKFIRSLIAIAGSILKRYKKSELSLWYLWKAFSLKPILVLTSKNFWKVLFFNLLNLIGIYSIVYK